MRTLFTHWSQVANRFRRAPYRLYLFDVDGTLAPIMETPAEVRLTRSVVGLLNRLARQKGCAVGVISGRSLKDVQRLVRLPGILYAGNHGLEARFKRRLWRVPGWRKMRATMQRLGRRLRHYLPSIRGLWVENKGLTLSVHFRQARRLSARLVRQRVRSLVQELGFEQDIELHAGKKVIDIRPCVKWSKGSIIHIIMRQFPGKTSVLYVGDDTTDEDAFRMLPSGAVGVRVGFRKNSSASYYLKRQNEIPKLLERLIRL